ncbi:MAG: hypothetical protein IKD69_03165 [Solobacterium sp.]|nr:hypothetical protein [Solobacterium sp.]
MIDSADRQIRLKRLSGIIVSAAGMVRDRSVLTGVLLIFASFFLTSAGYLGWLYHLLEIGAAHTDVLTMGFGYFLQAAGIGVYAWLARKGLSRRMLLAMTGSYAACLISALTGGMALSLLAGGAANFFCGMLAGFYLHELTRLTAAAGRAAAFGTGYGAAVIAAWLLTVFSPSFFHHAVPVLAVCLIASGAVLFLGGMSVSEPSRPLEQAELPPDSRLPVQACALALLFGIVGQIGFFFPNAVIPQDISLELSRLFYSGGLVLAGLLSDGSRRHGAIAALAALVIPFILLTLKETGLPQGSLWNIAYFASGFFSVTRVILTADLAERSGFLSLAATGLLWGRLGEAAGALVCFVTKGRLVAIVMIASLLYAASVAVFFRLYQSLWMPAAPVTPVQEDPVSRFARDHELSPRETEILVLLLEKKANAEICDILCVSESTVKFHIHNILKKTGCKNRRNLLAVYDSSQ